MNISKLTIPQRIEVLKTMVNLPVQVRHSAYTLAMSADDEISKPSDYLIDISLQSIHEARNVSLEDIRLRMKTPPYWVDVWPGEHYKLLAGLMISLKPKKVIEIGTATGLSAITIKKFMELDSKIYTFDIVPWNHFKETVLTNDDFLDTRLIQVLDDLSIASVMRNYIDLFKDVDIIFMDASKDGKFELIMMNHLKLIKFEKPPLILFDDIRLWNMLDVWRTITAPKIDLTSFGHWSGTGLVHFL